MLIFKNLPRFEFKFVRSSLVLFISKKKQKEKHVFNAADFLPQSNMPLPKKNFLFVFSIGNWLNFHFKIEQGFKHGLMRNIF